MKLKNHQISRKCYNKSVKICNKIHVYIHNNELDNYKVIFFLVRIEIKFLCIVINNCRHSIFCLNVYMPLFL